MSKSSQHKIKVVFILPTLNPGGAERVMSFVAQNLDKDQFDSSLWITGKPSDKDYKIENIECRYFEKPRVLKSVSALFTNLRKEKPHIVISSIAHLNTMMGLLSIFFPKIKFIGREANVLSVLNDFHNKKTGNSPLFRYAYLSLDKILCTSKDMLNDFKTAYNFPEKKLALINNPISKDFDGKKVPSRNKNHIQFVTVGSLKKQKGHERILNALSKLDLEYKYLIIGDGTEKDKIFAQINRLGLDNKVVHIPFTDKVDQYLSESDLFLQGAFVEGFPNCLLESVAIGLPIVAFNATGGLNEIVEEDVNGYIANNEDEFVSYVEKSVNGKKWDYEGIAKTAQTKYGTKKIISEYELLLKSLI